MLSSPAAAEREPASSLERRTRIHLAACHRLIAGLGLSDQSAAHISARLPDAPSSFLLKPHAEFFEEVTASSLLIVDLDGGDVEGDGAPNPAGFNIHAAVLRARPEVSCVVHTHTRAGLAVGAMQCGLLPLCQDALRFYRRIGYHDYEGIVDDPAEQGRLADDLGAHPALILRNHGLLIAGRSIAEAFRLTRMLERACRVQVDVLGAGTEPSMPAAEVCERTARQYESFGTMGGRDWAGEIRRLEGIDASFKR